MTESAKTDVGMAECYVPSEERVLDPSLIDKSILDRLPTPTGWRLLILPFRPPNKTAGGILLSNKTVEEGQIQTVAGYVLKVGPLAYSGERFSTGPWCEEGDWVMFGRYAGSRFQIDGGEIKILNDDEIIARVPNPEAILHQF